MQDNLGDNIELYIGSQINYESERVALRQAIYTLNANSIPSILIANTNIGNRQIDLIVATDDLALIVESKKANTPLRGDVNGFWEYRSATGEWKTIGKNYYQQTLDAKNALRDAMQRYSNEQVKYPEAALIFTSSIPNDSDIPHSDYKIHIGDIELLKNFSSYKRDSNWNLSKWRKFAQNLNLIKIDNLITAFDTKLLDATSLLQRYRNNFSKFYSPQTQNLVTFQCYINDNPVTSNEIIKRPISDECLLIVGPSGCGKSILARQIALSHLMPDNIPVLIEAKYFQRELGPLLNNEVTLLGASSITELMSACRLTGTSIFIILDGFNECSSSLRQRLVRCLNALVFRYQARLLVTSQVIYPDLKPLKLDEVQVPEPDINLKMAIARLPNDGDTPANIIELLSIVRSGLEANLVGQISETQPSNINRFTLFNTYVRKLLGDHAYDGINMLAHIGGYFHRNLSFSISIRELDRLLDARSWSSAVLRQLIHAHLLYERGDRISFGHELFLNVFSVEAIVRACGENAEEVLSAISAPKNSTLKRLIVGAIDNINTLDKVIEHIDDVDVIISCAIGECGQYAQERTNRHYQQILRNVEQEARSVSFKIDDSGWMNVLPEPKSLCVWNPRDAAFLAALPSLLGKGQFLDRTFEIVRIIEDRLQENFDRLANEARKRNLPLRSALFAAGLADQNSNVAIGKTIARISIQLSRDRQRDSVAIGSWVERKLSTGNISNGQLFMILNLCRHVWDANPLISLLPTFISERWKYAPYHLRIALLDAAQHSRNCTEEQRTALIDAINTIETDNLWISTSVIEALKSLGGLEDIDYEETVKTEIEYALSDPDNPENWSFARNLYDRQFDHPYDHVYYAVLHELPDVKRKEFLILAVRSKDNFRMFSSFMIAELAEFGDSATAGYIAHWTDIPPKDNSMPQDAADCFVLSHIALAQLKHPLPRRSFNRSDEDNAMQACGEVYYWLNRKDIAFNQRKEGCLQAWKVLLRHELGVSLSALMDCEDTFSRGVGRLINSEVPDESIIQNFPNEVSAICRHALSDGTTQHTRRPWMKQNELLDYAATTLGCCGGLEDLILLRGFADHQLIGSTAVRAIKQLEERLLATQ